ncbi:MAG: YchJ family protein [Inhella sp.]|jgi:SEC-C motif-containing protein|uniref:YchJ family protein n=1 Tax=Inhella sp. TaxID=1921806 RepID=UPI0022BBCED3|nr:YchJ family metal-binding protein [Inhella sp.]MCZ8236281.1 YchJ family metal-binding protein [Inhella sp.]
MQCPCTPARAYQDCCGAHHTSFAQTGRLTAPTAEALMRSRYSAFVLDLRDYLLASWHPSTRPGQLEAPEAGLKWLGLEVKAQQEKDDTATVAFVARSKLGGRAHRLVETSRFVREDGQWFYVDGDLA